MPFIERFFLFPFFQILLPSGLCGTANNKLDLFLLLTTLSSDIGTSSSMSGTASTHGHNLEWSPKICPSIAQKVFVIWASFLESLPIRLSISFSNSQCIIVS